MTVVVESRTSRRVVATAIGLGAALLAWSVACGPLVWRLRQHREAIGRVEQEWRRAGHLLRRRQALEAWEQTVMRPVGGDAIEPGLVSRLEAVARACGVTLAAVQPLDVRPKGRLRVSAVDVECHGAPALIASLLHGLQAASPPMRARHVRLAAQPSSGDVVAHLTVEQMEAP